MDSNTHSVGAPAGLGALVAAVDGLAAQDLDRLGDAALAERVLRMGPGTAAGWVRTARALFRGPLAGTAKALTNGELSPAHAQVLAAGTHDLPAHLAADAEPVLVEAARRLDPPRLRRAVAHLRLVADPDGADAQAERRHQQRGLWLAPTWEGMVAVDGLLEAEPARPCWLPWNPWPARPAPPTPVAAASGGLMPWRSWPVGLWRGAGCPRLVGCVPS
jgi:hypothetical protein